MVTPRYLVGIAGHRQLSQRETIRAALGRELKSLRELIQHQGGLLEVYSSVALGVDILACEEAAKLGLPVHVILPKQVILDDSGHVKKDQGFAADFWQEGKFLEDDWEAAWQIIQAAQKRVNGGTFRVVVGSQADPECYYDTDLQMLEAIDVLLAVWNGLPASGLGGTEHLVSLAVSADLPRVILDSVTGERTECCHLQRLDRHVDPSRQIFEHLEKFSRDCHQAQVPGEDGINTYFRQLEACSMKHSKVFRYTVVKTIYWHGAASLVAAFAAVIPQVDLGWKVVLTILAAIELTLVLKGLRTAKRLDRDETHERWMQSRFAAELMRSLFHSAGLFDPLHPLIGRHQPEWRRFLLTAGLMIYRSLPRLDWPQARDAYVRHRLCDPDLQIGQIAYFKTKQAEAEPRFKRWHAWGSQLAKAAIVFVIGALCYKSYVVVAKCWSLYYPPAMSTRDINGLSWVVAICFSFLPISLPLMASLLVSLRTALDSSRRTYRYKELAERLEMTAATLRTLQTEASVRRTVAATEDLLLDELIEWQLAEKQNGAH